jgi:hypothetical protein
LFLYLNVVLSYIDVIAFTFAIAFYLVCSPLICRERRVFAITYYEVIWKRTTEEAKLLNAL